MEPKASSTPVVCRLSGRRSIHNPEFESPIQCPDNNFTPQEPDDYNSEDIIAEESGTENELSDEYRTNDTLEENKDSQNQDTNNSNSPVSILAWIGVMVLAIYLGSIFNLGGTETPANDISAEFPEQTSDFWLSINTAIKEITRSNKPQSIVFIYDDSQSVDRMLRKIAEYAACQLRSCKEKPIELKSNYFTTPEVLSDYGTVIEDNRKRLSQSGVMVVHNLEKITGKTAQAFHSLCDEVSPVIGRALYMFTMATDKVPSEKEAIGYVEKRLKVLWNDMKSDNFQPLITRMTSFVLPVNRF